MNRFFFSLILSILVTVSAWAQSPVTWNAKITMTSETEGLVQLCAEIQDGWHVYDIKMPEDGPNPTKISFATTGIKWTDGMKVNKAAITEFDPIFEVEVGYWDHEVTFSRKFIVEDKGATIDVTVDYMCCNGSSCRPPVKDSFSLKVK